MRRRPARRHGCETWRQRALVVEMRHPQAFARRVGVGEAACEEAPGGVEAIQFQRGFGTLISHGDGITRRRPSRRTEPRPDSDMSELNRPRRLGRSRRGGLDRSHAALSRSHAADPRRGRRADGPHRHRHLVAVRRADAVRPRRGLPAADDQEAPSALDHRRIAVVPARRHQCPLAAGAQGQHLGRMGRRGGRARPGLRQAMARLGERRRAAHRPDRAT